MTKLFRATEGDCPSDSLFYAGIDGGATHCRASLYDCQQTLLSSGKGGPANPVNGLALTQRSILEAVSDALMNAGLRHLPLSSILVGAGLAGLHLSSQQQAMAAWQHPFKALYLTTDLHAALLGAHGGEDGAVIILGTGFSALGLVNGIRQPIGGYGFPINALASGSWFGLEAIKAVLLDVDGVGQATSLTSAILQHTDVLSLAEKMSQAPAQEFAAYAPLVFSHAQLGDACSMALIKQAAAFVERLMQRFVALGVNRIAFVGGVAPHIIPWLPEHYQSVIVPLQAPPEQGAMWWACQQHQWVHKQSL